MSKALKITDAEFEVMECLWCLGPATGNEVVAELTRTSPWKQSTILTLLRRLREKEVIDAGKSARGILHTPLVTREDCLEAMGSSFMAKFFGGSLMPMLAHFTRPGELSDAERQRLRDLLDHKPEGST